MEEKSEDEDETNNDKERAQRKKILLGRELSEIVSLVRTGAGETLPHPANSKPCPLFWFLTVPSRLIY